MNKVSSVSHSASFQVTPPDQGQIILGENLRLIPYAIEQGPVWSWVKKLPMGFDQYLKNAEGYFIHLLRNQHGAALEISAWKPRTFKDIEKARDDAIYDDNRNGIIRLEWDSGQGDTMISGIKLNQGAYLLKKEKAALEHPDDFEVLERIMVHPDKVPPEAHYQIDNAIQWMCKEVISTLRQGKSLALLGARFDRKQEARNRIKEQIAESLSAGAGLLDPAVNTRWNEREKYVVTHLCRMMREGVRNAGQAKLELPTRKNITAQMKKDFTKARRTALWGVGDEPAEIVDDALKALGLDWLK